MNISDENSVGSIVQKTLIDAGIDTYAPDSKKGDCKQPYTVLKYAGGAQAQQYSTEYQYYDLLCYVPKDQYWSLKPYVDICKAVMSKAPIYPMLMPTGVETPSFFDDLYNAHMISIQYRNNVRNEHL